MNRVIAFTAFLSATAISAASAYSQAPAVPAAAVAPATPTIWSFLGITQGMKKVRGALTNRRGNLPALEPKDAIKALNDPRNLVSSNPAIKKAAELKIQEDLKPQKVKAIKYLTSIGCGCYDKGGEVTAALIAAAEDCTEDVRLTVMQEVKAVACGKCCSNCGQVCCCSEKMLKKLAEIAFERDDTGCYKEPSARVRQAAAEALRACLPNSEPPCIAPEEASDEPDKPTPDTIPTPLSPEKSNEPSKTPLTEPKSASSDTQHDTEFQNAIQHLDLSIPEKFTGEVSSSTRIDAQRSSRRRFQIGDAAAGSETATQASALVPDQKSDDELEIAIHSELESKYGELAVDEGVVISFDKASRTAHVHFLNRQADLRVGDEINFESDPKSKDSIAGHWQIVYVKTGCIRMTSMDVIGGRSIQPGQHMMLARGAASDPVAPVSYEKP